VEYPELYQLSLIFFFAKILLFVMLLLPDVSSSKSVAAG